ncbi:nitroreductase family protein [Aneurinibacillus sp. Ricciae_BoGa-3]|uniref:nitroreductase family protein n=1 Tax=Aneurinibacillus sp. Ricciae_BoGa-3 TaxID=3022697 RepID=UPI0023413BD1|nr:nitroreductase family protein [Aneurinibacillus sp. Ricciae_BoGa-3]WCK55464.1 nitroreductase family protein [Aneurinibacillus sp. Ricciae_BoGa-3]
MATVVASTIADIMKARSSVRAYQKGKTIPKETLRGILELAGTAPSAWNLQHWKFIVVQNEERKQRLLPIAYGQKQVADASAVVIVLGDTQANKNAEKAYAGAVEAGYMTQEAKNTLFNNINQAYARGPELGVHEAIRNAAFAAMQFMLAAKSFGLDTCPMGGYDPVALRKELNIPERYTPILMMSLGYAEKPAHETGRFSVDDILVEETF